MNGRGRALVELGSWLRSRGYRFVTPTPATHQRVIQREAEARDVRGIFGWSQPFRESLLPPAIVGLLREANAVREEGALLRSTVRFATLRDDLYAHSAYPTDAADSVFFGPDTYRFADLIERERGETAASIVDIGCGAGAGALVAAAALRPTRLVLADINAAALELAAVNLALAGVPGELVRSDVLASVAGGFDLAIANPPYLADAAARTYRDGGAGHGSALSLRIVEETLERLNPGGRLVLYTGAAIVNGTDVLRSALTPLLRRHRARYFELDPDVFGEELERPEYAEVERIAAVGLVIQKELA